MKLIIMQDDKRVDEVECEEGKSETALYKWFHGHTSQSMSWAIRHEGYWVANEDGSPALTKEHYKNQWGR